MKKIKRDHLRALKQNLIKDLNMGKEWEEDTGRGLALVQEMDAVEAKVEEIGGKMESDKSNRKKY